MLISVKQAIENAPPPHTHINTHTLTHIHTCCRNSAMLYNNPLSPSEQQPHQTANLVCGVSVPHYQLAILRGTNKVPGDNSSTDKTTPTRFSSRPHPHTTVSYTTDHTHQFPILQTTPTTVSYTTDHTHLGGFPQDHTHYCPDHS